MKSQRIYLIVESAVVAALYYVLTALIFAPISFGSVQFRVAEAMMVLPALSPTSSLGLFVGCLLANLLNPLNLGPIDVVLGSLTTLLAALATAGLARYLPPKGQIPALRSPKLWLLPLPTVVLNGLIVGTYLPFLLSPETVNPSLILFSILTVALGELGVLYILGIPLLLALRTSPLARRGRRGSRA